MKNMNDQKIRQQLAQLTAGQKQIPMGGTTVAEILFQLPAGAFDGPLTDVYSSLDEHQLVLLGRLSTILDVLAVQQRRTVLVRWFD